MVIASEWRLAARGRSRIAETVAAVVWPPTIRINDIRRS